MIENKTSSSKIIYLLFMRSINKPENSSTKFNKSLG